MAKDLTAAWAALSEGSGTSRKDARLPEAPTLPAIPPRTGSAKPKATAGSGGGIASPLTETAYAARLWFSERTVFTSDGIFPMRVRPINTIYFLDANGEPVEQKYKAPA